MVYNLKNLSTKKLLLQALKRFWKICTWKDINKAVKIGLIKKLMFYLQDIRTLENKSFQKLLHRIEKIVFALHQRQNYDGTRYFKFIFLQHSTNMLGKSDKNQAFTPDHIVKFMWYSRNKSTYKVLDPCCGSGAFLVSNDWCNGRLWYRTR